MDTPTTPVPRPHGWLAGLALISVVVPVAAVRIGGPAATPSPAAPSLNGFLPTVVALALGIACAVSTSVFNRSIAPSWLRWLSIGMAVLGSGSAAVQLAGLIGMCGLDVVWGVCTP